MGNGIELGTFCIWLTDCHEMSELPVVNDDPEEEPEGTKFVVFFADVENATQEEFTFNNREIRNYAESMFFGLHPVCRLKFWNNLFLLRPIRQKRRHNMCADQKKWEKPKMAKIK